MKERWQETAELSQSSRVPSHYLHLAITESPEGRSAGDLHRCQQSSAGGGLDVDATTRSARVGRVKVLVQCAAAPIRAGLSGYVAELGAAFLAADLGLAIEPRPDHASYIASWITLWRGEHKPSNREVQIM